MKKHCTALFLVGLTLAGAACNRGKADAERKAEEERKAQEATTTAAQVQAEETARLKAAHADTRIRLQKDLDAHDRKAAYLKQKASKAVGAAKKNADAAIAELEARRAAARVTMDRLGDDMAPTWDATKKAAEEDIAAVGRAVDALEKTITKK